ncbi:DUF2339 domain-containing protein [Aquimonas voraii]|uniref:Uncharacterized membrane protein n=1 Tax=Aquimonas voraii TaxID=265719 RepID=A0A1G6Y7L1_9GAMM|nr:DUF2339 domain-containing protein [Aquimonas voraii]SDD86419.1 Uncharacterized membrane protein [Aquimonas voraii]
MKIVLAVVFGLLAVASESLVSVLLAALAGWLLGSQRELAQRLRRLEARRAMDAPGTAHAGTPDGTMHPPARPASPARAPAATAQQTEADKAARPAAVASAPTVATESGSGLVTRDAAVPQRAEAITASAEKRVSPPPLPAGSQRMQAAGSAAPAAPAPGAPSTLRASTRPVAETLLGWLFGGNLPVKLGVLVLFAGVAAALRYAAQQGMFELPIGWRFIGIGATAIGALLFALGQRRSRPAFSLSLQGGAMGVLLLCVFAAFRLYALLAPGVALAMVVMLVASAALLAVLQNAAALAVLGFLGGYLAPVLISTGSGDQVALFSYYAALNAAVFSVAWWRHWHALNLMGFLFTFGVGSLWGLRSYTAADYASSQFFLLLFWAFYLGIAVLGALRRGLATSHGVQASLTFALPLWGFSLQAGLLEGDRSALSMSAVLAAAVYAGLAALLVRNARARLQGEAFAWVAVGFLTVAVPLAFSAQQTAAVWALQGVGAMWLGLRQRRPLSWGFGWLLQFAGGCALLMHAAEALNDGRFEDSDYRIGLRLSLALLAGAGLLASRLHERFERSSIEIWLGFLLGASWLGLLWMHVGWHPPFALDHCESLLASVVLIALGASLLRNVLGWPRLGWLSVAPLVALPLLGLCALIEQEAPALEGRGLVLWALGFVAAGVSLRALREPPMRLTGAAHLAVLATLVLVLGSDFAQRAERADLGGAWIWALAVLPLAALAWGLWRQPQRFAWPLADRFSRYARLWQGAAVLALGAAWLGALYSSADPAPMSYLPLLNPMELLQWGVLLLAWRALPQEARSDLLPLRAGLAAAALLLLTLAALRSLHHHAGLPWSPALFDSALTQGVLSVLWALGGVIAWVAGSRRGNWYVWLGGATLMGVVLVKLVLVDRAYLGNLAGIGAVLTVGLLLVGVGYLAPSPPRRAEAAKR